MIGPARHGTLTECALAALIAATTALGLLTAPLITVAAAVAILGADIYRSITAAPRDEDAAPAGALSARASTTTPAKQPARSRRS